MPDVFLRSVHDNSFLAGSLEADSPPKGFRPVGGQIFSREELACGLWVYPPLLETEREAPFAASRVCRWLENRPEHQPNQNTRRFVRGEARAEESR